MDRLPKGGQFEHPSMWSQTDDCLIIYFKIRLRVKTVNYGIDSLGTEVV